MNKYFIKAGKLIDVEKGVVLENQAILVEGESIKEVGGWDILDETLSCVDYSDKVVMPGLFNCHVHLDSDPISSGLNRLEKTQVERIMQIYENLQTYLDTGVTFIRNQGSDEYLDIQFRDYINMKKMDGPTILASGKCICMTGGHGWNSGIEADGVNECLKAARTVLKHGADSVKIMATGGVMTKGVEPGNAQLTYEEIKVIVDEAHKAGKLTATHAQGTEGILNTVKAGIDSVEHGIYLTDEIIEMMKEKDIYLVPTLAAVYFILKEGESGKIAQYMVDKCKKVVDSHMNSFRMAYKAGVKIALGTDAGTPFNLHDQTYMEAKLMIEQGLPPMEAIKAGTINAATMLRVDQDYGSIKAGKKADILVLNDDPLENIDTLSSICALFKHGKKVRG